MSNIHPWAARTKRPWSEREQLHRERRQELWAWLWRERREGEPLWTTARRALLGLALESSRNKKEAAKLLGVTPRTITYYKHRDIDERLKPKVAK